MKLTQKHIDSLIEKSQVDCRTVFSNVTQVTVKLPNGYVVSQTMGCIDPSNYSEKIGYEICIERIKNKLWDLEGYAAINNIQ